MKTIAGRNEGETGQKLILSDIGLVTKMYFIISTSLITLCYEAVKTIDRPGKYNRRLSR